MKLNFWSVKSAGTCEKYSYWNSQILHTRRGIGVKVGLLESRVNAGMNIIDTKSQWSENATDYMAENKHLYFENVLLFINVCIEPTSGGGPEMFRYLWGKNRSKIRGPSGVKTIYSDFTTFQKII